MRNLETARARRFHILNQYLWPDGAPTGIYAEQLADGLNARGFSAVLVGGGGSYRRSARPQPQSQIVTLRCHGGRRGSHLSTLREYGSIHRAFAGYIAREVARGDVVIVTSAPPSSLTLHREVHRAGATAVYWLQDYYPELLRGVWRFPQPIRAGLNAFWGPHLRRWDHVVKAAANLGYDGPNVCVLRNWPTLAFDEDAAPEPHTALYSGNLGYGHDVGRFIAECETLHRAGCRIAVHGDGPGMARLPGWIAAAPPFSSEAEMRATFLRNEVHLVAADPEIRAAIFPSKIWNSLAAGRRIVCSGFEGEMLAELEASRCSPFARHREMWVEWALALAAQ